MKSKVKPKRLPKIGTVCLEGYKISKDGRCIKDKKHNVFISKTKPKRLPKIGTVCLEGYKISKDGRCIKDKSYNVFVEKSNVDSPEYLPNDITVVSAPSEIEPYESLPTKQLVKMIEY